MSSHQKEYQLDKVSIRMVKEPPLYSKEQMTTPEAAVRVIKEAIDDYDREVFCVINLRADLSPINMNIVSVGALNMALAHPREVMKSVILSNASNIMIMHNHPSGRLVPSKADITTTDHLSQLCNLMEIPIVDHIIVGPGKDYYSFRENQILPLNQMHFTAKIEQLDMDKMPKIAERSSVLTQLTENKKRISDQNINNRKKQTGIDR
ncbi:MAG: JAB domain-containing protein [Lachnospiraceae bacterium]|nr:JAB domain-containing protein [Lachnospiraceae bacterium]